MTKIRIDVIPDKVTVTGRIYPSTVLCTAVNEIKDKSIPVVVSSASNINDKDVFSLIDLSVFRALSVVIDKDELFAVVHAVDAFAIERSIGKRWHELEATLIGVGTTENKIVQDGYRILAIGIYPKITN